MPFCHFKQTNQGTTQLAYAKLNSWVTFIGEGNFSRCPFLTGRSVLLHNFMPWLEENLKEWSFPLPICRWDCLWEAMWPVLQWRVCEVRSLGKPIRPVAAAHTVPFPAPQFETKLASALWILIPGCFKGREGVGNGEERGKKKCFTFNLFLLPFACMTRCLCQSASRDV